MSLLGYFNLFAGIACVLMFFHSFTIDRLARMAKMESPVSWHQRPILFGLGALNFIFAYVDYGNLTFGG